MDQQYDMRNPIDKLRILRFFIKSETDQTFEEMDQQFEEID